MFSDLRLVSTSPVNVNSPTIHQQLRFCLIYWAPLSSSNLFNLFLLPPSLLPCLPSSFPPPFPWHHTFHNSGLSIFFLTSLDTCDSSLTILLSLWELKKQLSGLPLSPCLLHYPLYPKHLPMSVAPYSDSPIKTLITISQNA